MFITALFRIARICKQPVSIDASMEKLGHEYTIKYYMALKKEKPAICNNMDGLWEHYSKLNKSDWERQTLYDFTCMFGMKVVKVTNFQLEDKYVLESWAPKNWCFWTVVLEKTLESRLDCKEIQPVHPKGYQSWIFIGRTDAEAETPILWPLDVKNWLIGKDPDAGKGWR